MSSEAGELRRVLTPFRERPMSVQDPEARRERIVAALRRLVRELPIQRRRRNRLRWFGALAAAAGVLGGAALTWSLSRVDNDRGAPGALSLRELGGVVLLEDAGGERRLARGDELQLPLDGQLRVEQGGSAQLTTPRGLKLSLASDSVVALGELGRAAQERLKLMEGEVTCQVPRLGQGESFAVVTPSARVVVHGTVFKVRVNDGAGEASTCVEVSEGAVLVHHPGGQVALNSGESWGCEPRPSEPKDREQALLERSDPPEPARDPAEARKPAGTLEPEVRLLQNALVQERNGDPAGAERSLRLLLRRYPQSPLSTEARAALARIRSKR